MSSCRRKAIALFPQHRAEFEQAADIAQVFFRLSMEARDPHEAYALDQTNESARLYLQHLHGFVEWTLRQPELWTKAAIGFYEDLFATVRWEWIVPWLSPFAIEQIRQTWAFGVDGKLQPKFDRLLAERADDAYKSHVFATGAIDGL